MNDSLDDMNTSDPNTPEMPAGAPAPDYGFSGDPFDLSYSPPAPTPRRGPWLLLAAIVGGGVLLTVLVVGVKFLWSRGEEGPEQIVQAYYTQLQAEDFVSLGQFIDPDEPIHDNVLPFVGMLKERVESLTRDYIGVDVRIRWEFNQLDFQTVERQSAAAKVHVTGKLHIYDEGSGLGPTLPFNYTHLLIKKSGHWYLQP